MAEAVAHCRQRAGLRRWCTRTCTRPYSHSLSDDEKLYKPQAERDAEAARDPLAAVSGVALRRGHPGHARLEMLMHQVDQEIQEATEHALKAPPPPAGEALRFLYSDRVDPTSSAFRDRAAIRRRSAHHGGRDHAYAARGDAPQLQDRRVRRGCGRLQPRRKSASR